MTNPLLYRRIPARWVTPTRWARPSFLSVSGVLLAALAFSSTGCSDGTLGPLPNGDPSIGDGDDGSSPSGDGDTSTNGSGGGLGSGDGDGDGDMPPPPDPGTAPGGVKLHGEPVFHSVVRLTHDQWGNSIEDIFGVESTELVSTLYPDPPKGTYSNNERALYVEGELWGDYQRVAEQIAQQVATDSSLASRFGGVQDSGAFMDAVAHRLFRRSLSAEEKSEYQDTWDLGATYYASGDDAVDGARVFLEAALQSPFFVYRIETVDPGARLSGAQLATKLSLLLTDRLPSQDLLDKAESGELDTNAGLVQAAESMLTGESALNAVKRFHTELYGLSRYKNIRKNETQFPEYSTDLNPVLLEADLMYFAHIFETGGGIREIFTSDVAYVNRQLASFYDVSASGDQLTQTSLGPDRPGFLTRLGFLTYNATLVDPDPIHRGVEINRKILCTELEPPDGTIPPLPQLEPGQTNRERVTAHTDVGGCAQCHTKVINPPGFAFENFDAVGKQRTTDNGKPVDTASEFAFNDGVKAFTNGVELIELIADHDQTHSCYSAHLTEFVLGRDVAGTETELVTALHGSSMSEGASIKELMLTVIQDPLFTNGQPK